MHVLKVPGLETIATNVSSSVSKERSKTGQDESGRRWKTTWLVRGVPYRDRKTVVINGNVVLRTDIVITWWVAVSYKYYIGKEVVEDAPFSKEVLLKL